MQCVVIAAGPGARGEGGRITPRDVKKGECSVREWSGTEVKIDGEDLLSMKESEILGVIERKSIGACRGVIAVLSYPLGSSP